MVKLPNGVCVAVDPKEKNELAKPPPRDRNSLRPARLSCSCLLMMANRSAAWPGRARWGARRGCERPSELSQAKIAL
jgi:hypothetical protein